MPHFWSRIIDRATGPYTNETSAEDLAQKKAKRRKKPRKGKKRVDSGGK